MSCQLIEDLGTSKDGKRTPFYWVFLLLPGLRAEERPTFARHSQSPVAHLSTRRLLKGQGVPQLEHIQEKPGGEKQSWTNLLMCTCTCVWKGAFREEVCLPFFIKKSVFFICRHFYTMWHMMFIFTPSFSLSFPVPGEPFVLYNTPLLAATFTSSCFVCFLCEHLEFTGVPWALPLKKRTPLALATDDCQ